MNNTQPPNVVQPKMQPADDEIDLRQVIAALVRQKYLIACVTGGAILCSCWYAFSRKPVWEGQFQIVVEQHNSGSRRRLSQLAAANPLLVNLAGFGYRGGSHLNTEVKILESPSVLKPTYDFVKAKKAKAGEDVSRWTFHSWRDNKLEIALEKGTSVLNIAYRDTDREIILPVIRKISSDYQRYSGRDRNKSISNGLAFAKEQVELFRNRAAASTRALDAFSILYGISTRGPSVGSSGVDISKLLNPNSSWRASGSIGSTISPSIRGDALGQLAAINQELIRRQQRFTSRDPGVIALIRERDALRRYIELTAGGSLSLPGQQPASKEQAQELILQFKKLNRTAKRDASTLDELESSLLSLQLEQARQTDPWELISTPTLLDNPVAPQKKRMVALGLVGGLLLGCGAALIRDHRGGIVFSDEELNKFLPGPLLERLSLKQPNTWAMAFDLIAQGSLSQANSVALIPVGQPESENLQAIAKALQMSLSRRQLVVSKDLVKTRSCDSQLLLVQPGKCSRSQLSQLQQSLALQGTHVAGWLLLDPTV